MQITTDQFTRMFGNVPDVDTIVTSLNTILPEYDITTPARVCAFLAQAGHESANFKVKTENLMYSAPALLAVFPKYFNATLAGLYARNPLKIASRVYANRMGNGDEASQEGYKYRGRGYIQLTGKDNYVACGNDINVDLTSTPEYLETVEGAIYSACWFWDQHSLNDLADTGSMTTITQRINGGTNGLADRLALFAKAKTIFA